MYQYITQELLRDWMGITIPSYYRLLEVTGDYRRLLEITGDY